MEILVNKQETREDLMRLYKALSGIVVYPASIFWIAEILERGFKESFEVNKDDSIKR